MSRVARFDSDRGLVVMLGLIALAVIVIAAVGAGTTFMRGDWVMLVDRRGPVDVVFEPHGANIVIGISLLYRGLVAVFGLDPLAFRIVLLAAFAVASLLLFVTLRRRVGDGLALLGVGLTLLMGAAYQDLLWPLQIGYVTAIACGLGALLALARNDGRGASLACVLLVAGSLTFSAGLAFVAGAAVAIGLAPEARRRVWVVAVPLALALAWWLIWGRDADVSVTFEDVLGAPVFMFEGFAASLAALLGLSTPQNASSIDGIEWGRVLVVIGALAAALRVYRLGRVPAGLWVALATAAAFWLVAGFFEQPGRLASASRYMYPGAVFVLWMTAELLAGMTIRRPVLIAAGAVVAMAVASSAYYLGHASDRFERQGNFVRAGLAAVEITRDRVVPSFTLEKEIAGTGWAPLSAGAYLEALDDYGGDPGFSEEALRTAPGYARTASDRVLAEILGLRAAPVAQGPGVDCGVVEPGTVTVPPGGTEFRPLDGDARVALSRFSGSYPVDLGTLGPGGSKVVIPPDASTRPWRAEISGESRVRVCALR